MVRVAKSIAVLMALALLAGCGSGSGGGSTEEPPTGGGPDPNSRKIDRGEVVPGHFADCDAYLAYLAEAFFASLTNPQPCGFGWCPLEVALGPPLPAAPGDGTPDDVSQTNTQEEGIDEGDLVETDADGNLYILNRQRLVIADGFPPEQTAVIAEVDLAGFDYGYGQQMLLDEAGHRLVVFETGWRAEPAPGRQVTMVWLIDVSDPAAPFVDGTMLLDGYLLASRRNGARVHAFTWRGLNLPTDFYASGGWELVQQYHTAAGSGDDAALAATAAALRERIVEALSQGFDAYLPRVVTSGNADGALECTELAAPGVEVEPALSMIVSFDTDGANVGSAALVNNVGVVYAAADNAYLTQSSRGWWWDAVQADETAIYKFAIGAGAPEYRAAGVVAGQVWNNLQMSERDGWLRVVTNETIYDPVGGFGLTNHLFVLDDDAAGGLHVAAAVEDFVRNEDIYSVRFAGANGYVVTFRRIDPLFTFDLSDPLNPRRVGELELPGFSTYMQPIDDSHLLTIGREGDEAGNIGPLALRIFDVSDLAAPQLAHAYLLEDSGSSWAGWSPAAHDYRAFNYYVPRGLLSLPYTVYESGWQDSFTGFVYFEIDTVAGILEVGRINHNDLVGAAYCPDPATCDYASLWFGAEPQRSVIMTDGPDSFIHTVSNVGVKVTPADDPGNVLASFVLPAE